MTAVFVHGVPDTYRIWNPLRRQLQRDNVIALALPGFDSPLPAGFTATKEAYVDWIISQLEKQPKPVDLVGHDWGCILTARVASLRPDLLRTWAGGSGPISRNYEWHKVAKIWQTPEVGERYMANLDRGKFAQLIIDDGVSEDKAKETVDHVDDTMKDCILRLYRSAVQVGEEWEPGLANITTPSLVFWGAKDPGTQIAFGHQLGRAMHASNVVTLDCGHFTPLLKTEEIARALTQHWTQPAPKSAAV
jgi:pimeloyl-ACP methyl ester carboxylesterase